MLAGMLTVTHRPLTAHDYRELPEDGPRYQLIEGELHMAPAPNRFHQTILLRLAQKIQNHLDQHQTGKIFIAPFDVYLTDINVYQPDICYFSEKRYPYLTDEGAAGAPELVVEILSPRTAKFDLGLKKEVYRRTGVREYWVIEPDTKIVKVFRLAENADTPVATLEETDSLSTDFLPGLVLPLATVFAT